MRKLIRLTYLLLLGFSVVPLWHYVIKDSVVRQHFLSMHFKGHSFLRDGLQSREIKQNSVTWNNRTVVLHPDVKVVPSTLPDDQLLVNQDCVPLPRTPRQGVVICVYPVREDKFVSGALKVSYFYLWLSGALKCNQFDIWLSASLKKGQLWEDQNLMQMQVILQANPEMVMVDVGSNIGLYTLYAAALGRPVVAVEMMPTNVRHIQKALGLSKLGSDVVIVNNALFSDHRTLATKFVIQNLGGTRLNVSSTVEKVNSTHETVYVQTICLDELTPLLDGATVYMKMDIENSEHHALRCAHAFFQRVNVRYVQMELAFRTVDEREQIIKFMSTHGYTLSATPDGIVAVDLTTITADVYFIKKV